MQESAVKVAGADVAAELAAVVRMEFADHLRTGAREAADYIERYAFQLVTNRPASYPHPPLTMHSALRHMARELCRDEAALLRRQK